MVAVIGDEINHEEGQKADNSSLTDLGATLCLLFANIVIL